MEQRQLGDAALLGVVIIDSSQEVSNVEDLLLLSRYDEAASTALELVCRFSDGRDESDAILQRALAAALKAHFFSGRQHEVEAVVERLGITRLTVPTVVDWVLLLLENGQAPAARQLVERYMAVVMELLSMTTTTTTTTTTPGSDPRVVPPLESGTLPPQQLGSRPSSTDSPGDGHEGPATVRHPPLGAATATLEDRAALARLYSQDVLSLGLQQPQEARRWLSPPSPHRRPQQPQLSQAGPGSNQPHPQTDGQVKSCHQAASRSGQRHGSPDRALEGGGEGTAEAGGGTGAVVGARELVGCDERLGLLRRELQQLLLASGMLRRSSSEESGGSSNGNGHGSNGNGSNGGAQASSKRGSLDNGLRGPLVGVTKAAGPGKPGLAAAAAVAAAASARRETAATPPGASGSGGGSGGSAPGSAHRGKNDVGGRTSLTPAPSAAGTGARPPTGFAAYLHIPGAPHLTNLLRAWLAAAVAVAQRLVSASLAQLSAAQAWLVCKAAAAVARLREGAPGPAGLLAQLHGMLTSSSAPSSSYRRYGNAAAALAVVTLAVVAMTAEAPHLRAALQGQWVWLAGLVREAASMGMAMHPSPVATTAVR